MDGGRKEYWKELLIEGCEAGRQILDGGMKDLQEEDLQDRLKGRKEDFCDGSHVGRPARKKINSSAMTIISRISFNGLLREACSQILIDLKDTETEQRCEDICGVYLRPLQHCVARLCNPVPYEIVHLVFTHFVSS